MELLKKAGEVISGLSKKFAKHEKELASLHNSTLLLQITENVKEVLTKVCQVSAELWSDDEHAELDGLVSRVSLKLDEPRTVLKSLEDQLITTMAGILFPATSSIDHLRTWNTIAESLLEWVAASRPEVVEAKALVDLLGRCESLADCRDRWLKLGGETSARAGADAQLKHLKAMMSHCKEVRAEAENKTLDVPVVAGLLDECAKHISESEQTIVSAKVAALKEVHARCVEGLGKAEFPSFAATNDLEWGAFVAEVDKTWKSYTGGDQLKKYNDKLPTALKEYTDHVNLFQGVVEEILYGEVQTTIDTVSALVFCVKAIKGIHDNEAIKTKLRRYSKSQLAKINGSGGSAPLINKILVPTAVYTKLVVCTEI